MADQPTDYTDPTTIDIDTVLGEINSAFKMRGETWTADLSWPNVTVKALADEITRLNGVADECALLTARNVALRATLYRVGFGDEKHPDRMARFVLKALYPEGEG